MQAMNQRERIHLVSSEVVWHLCGPSPPPPCLFLSLTVCQFHCKTTPEFTKRTCCFFFFSPADINTRPQHVGWRRPTRVFSQIVAQETEHKQKMTKSEWSLVRANGDWRCCASLISPFLYPVFFICTWMWKYIYLTYDMPQNTFLHDVNYSLISLWSGLFA